MITSIASNQSNYLSCAQLCTFCG